MTRDLVSSAFLLLFSIYIAIESYRQDIGELHSPGPGFFPFVASAIFGLLSISVLMQALRQKKDENAAEKTESFHLTNISVIVAAMLVYVFAMKFVGFIVCTFFFVLFLIRIVAKQSWPRSIVVSLSVTVACHVVFNVLLNAQLPRGLL